MVRYLETTVRSVIEQDYPHIEHVVMDGGSTDGSLDLLERYKDRVRVISAPDSGPAEAINRGIACTKGEIVTFLNADDYYFPGAVSAAARHLERLPDAGAVYGEGLWVDESGNEIGRYPVEDFSADKLREACFICQPASFLRRKAVESIGGLDATLRYTFDYDLWIRLAARYPLARIGERLAASRMRRDNISLGSRREVFRETIDLLKRHFGYVPFRWIHSYSAYLTDHRDQFFEPLRPGFTMYLASLPIGLYHNARRPWRYLGEWRRVMSREALRRRLNESWMR